VKTITLDQAYKILENAAAVIWDDNFLCYVSLSQLTDEPDNEWLRLHVTDDEGLEYSANFIQEGNETVRVEGSSMFLKDDNGDEVQVSVLAHVDGHGTGR
jgi:hypothetical protein